MRLCNVLLAAPLIPLCLAAACGLEVDGQLPLLTRAASQPLPYSYLLCGAADLVEVEPKGPRAPQTVSGKYSCIVPVDRHWTAPMWPKSGLYPSDTRCNDEEVKGTRGFTFRECRTADGYAGIEYCDGRGNWTHGCEYLQCSLVEKLSAKDEPELNRRAKDFCTENLSKAPKLAPPVGCTCDLEVPHGLEQGTGVSFEVRCGSVGSPERATYEFSYREAECGARQATVTRRHGPRDTLPAQPGPDSVTIGPACNPCDTKVCSDDTLPAAAERTCAVAQEAVRKSQPLATTADEMPGFVVVDR